MNSSARTALLILFVALSLVGSIWALQLVEAARGPQATLEDVLYISSGKTLKRLSLGYSGLLADIYWTRAVQYFGPRVQETTHFELLDPLLEITTDLDPHLIPAYENGSIFLSQNVPYGAGQPDKAVALLEKGIRENPGHWRLYFTLGFINYLDRKDYKAAQDAFQRGSGVPGALPFMKVMAARMAEHANDVGTAIALWQAVFNTNRDPAVRDTAAKHINSLHADVEMAEIEKRIQMYRETEGALPSTWKELIDEGYLRDIPIDPTGHPYKLENGTVQVAISKDFPFLGESRR